MKTIFYAALLSFFLPGLFSSCVKKKTGAVEDSEVIVYDTPARGETVHQEEVKENRREVQSFRTDDYNKLKRYNVIVATLTNSEGINALGHFFERDGIDHFVVRNPENGYYFIVHSSDSEEAAMQARGEFLIRNTVDKSREDIWRQYYVQLTDAFILEK